MLISPPFSFPLQVDQVVVNSTVFHGQQFVNSYSKENAQIS